VSKPPQSARCCTSPCAANMGATDHNITSSSAPLITTSHRHFVRLGVAMRDVAPIMRECEGWHP
jgi:hypothetical protein